MTARVKLYQELIRDVQENNLTLDEAKELLGIEFETWYRIYILETKARDAYKRYTDALKILETTKVAYERSVANTVEKRKLYDKYTSALKRAEDRFGTMIQPLWEALEAMGAVEEDLIDDPVSKMIQIQQYKERSGNTDLNIPIPFTPEEKLKIAVFGQNVKQKVVSFNNIFERTLIMEHNITEYVNKPYMKSQLEMMKARIDMEQALKTKNIAQVDYENYVLFSILGIL